MTALTIRELDDIEGLTAVSRLFDEIWRPDPAQPGQAPVTFSMLRALAHTGNYVAGAFRDGQLVGASVGFRAADQALHSHVTGVVVPGAGWELKQHQRGWAAERGLRRVTWTFDPLVRRNAHFNLAKLGARPVEYLPRFYGTMDDGINAGDESDRLLMSWELDASPALPDTDGAVVVLDDQAGRPVRLPADGNRLLVGLPGDVESLRQRDASAAREWRIALREILGGLLAEGAQVIGFVDKSHYVVERAAREPR